MRRHSLRVRRPFPKAPLGATVGAALLAAVCSPIPGVAADVFAESPNLTVLTSPAEPEAPAADVSTVAELAPLVLFDSQTPLDVATTQDVELRRAESGALEVANGKKDRWPGFHLLAERDLGDYSALEAKITNLNAEPITLHCRLDCAATRFPEGSTTLDRSFAPGETAVWRIALPASLNLETRAKLFAMRGKPGGIKTDGYSNDAKIPFDKRTLTAIRLFENQNGRGDRWTLESLVAVPISASERAANEYLSWGPDRFFPTIDRFGQFIHRDWPGKTRSLDDLRAQIDRENADLAANQPTDFDEFGGWASGPRLEATGAFRTEKIDGVWYLVDPAGRLFWSNGVDCVGHNNGVTPITDREFYFVDDVPKERTGGPLDAFLGYSENSVNNYYAGRGRYAQYNFTASNLYLKFGENWREAEKDLAPRRLRSWGLNTIGNWSDAEICAVAKTPYTATISIKAPKIEGSAGYWGKFSDPFAPEFAKAVRDGLNAQKARTADDPYCVGYFVDNEISWGGAGSLAKAALASPKTQPAKIAFVDRLREKYGADSPEKLDAAWGTSFADWDSLLNEPFDVEKSIEKSDAATDDAKKAVKADCDAFYSVLCEKYFAEILAAVREIAPKKLYLGCRFAWSNTLAIAAAQKYCDVVSYNFYRAEVGSFRPVEGPDKPVIIGEFHFGALDRGLFHTGLGPTASQDERAAAYERYVRSALGNPWIVGAHWFQYGDQATTGRSDGENYQIGLVDVCDRPYVETIAAVRRVGYSMYETRKEAQTTDEALKEKVEER